MPNLGSNGMDSPTPGLTVGSGIYRSNTMTEYRKKVLRAVEHCPGAGPCNVCDIVSDLEAVNILNADKALKWLTDNGYLIDGYVSPKGEQALNHGATPCRN